jgi:hypothetical protein
MFITTGYILYSPQTLGKHWIIIQCDEEIVSISLYPENIGTNGIYFWIPVECRAVRKIRLELGLTAEPPVPLHMSIGHL